MERCGDGSVAVTDGGRRARTGKGSVCRIIASELEGELRDIGCDELPSNSEDEGRHDGGRRVLLARLFGKEEE